MPSQESERDLSGLRKKQELSHGHKKGEFILSVILLSQELLTVATAGAAVSQLASGTHLLNFVPSTLVSICPGTLWA